MPPVASCSRVLFPSDGSSALRLCQFRRVLLYLTHCFDDLVHIRAWAEQHGLREPDRFGAELVVFRTRNPLRIAVQIAAAERTFEAAQAGQVLDERLLIQGPVAGGGRYALGIERLDELVAAQPVEALRIVAEHIEVIGIPGGALV